jgi:hypothetical protein
MPSDKHARKKRDIRVDLKPAPSLFAIIVRARLLKTGLRFRRRIESCVLTLRSYGECCNDVQGPCAQPFAGDVATRTFDRLRR